MLFASTHRKWNFAETRGTEVTSCTDQRPERCSEQEHRTERFAERMIKVFELVCDTAVFHTFRRVTE